MKKIFLSLFTMVATAGFAAEVQTSPDGNLSLSFDVNENGSPVYSVDFKGKSVISPSTLGVELIKRRVLP